MGARLVEHSTLVEIHGEQRVDAVVIKNGQSGTQTLSCQLVLWAIGQDKRFDVCQEFPGVQLQQGHIVVDEHMMTGARGIFACGDAVNSGKEVVNAAAEAKLAALAIDRFLN